MAKEKKVVAKKTTAKKTATAAKKVTKKTTKKAAATATANNALLKNAISYVPLVGIVLYFVEKDKSAELMKHIKYGTVLFVAYIVLSVLLTSALTGIIALVYLAAIAFLGYKAYTGEAVELDFIDKLEDEVKSKIK